MEHELKKRPSFRGRRRAGQVPYYCARCGLEGTKSHLKARECKPEDTAEPLALWSTDNA